MIALQWAAAKCPGTVATACPEGQVLQTGSLSLLLPVAVVTAWAVGGEGCQGEQGAGGANQEAVASRGRGTFCSQRRCYARLLSALPSEGRSTLKCPTATSRTFNWLRLATVWPTQVTHTPRHQWDDEHSCVGPYSEEPQLLRGRASRKAGGVPGGPRYRGRSLALQFPMCLQKQVTLCHHKRRDCALHGV